MRGFDSEAFGISTIVDVFDEHDLFDFLNDERILELSRLGGVPGFSGLNNIRKSTGIRQRRILRPGVTARDLAIRLCERLEDESGALLAEFDSILLCHSSTNVQECENLAADLIQSFGLRTGQLQSFNHGCTGFLKLLHDATIDIEALPPGSRIAILSVETPEFWHDAADRLFCGLVSAGATAAVIEPDGRFPLGRVLAGDFVIPDSRRPNPDPLFLTACEDGFTFRQEPCRRTVMHMNPEPVFINAIELMLNSLRAALESFDAEDGERIVVAPHQPSGKLLRALVATAQPEFPHVEFLNNLPSYGNMISSSVPAVLSRLDEVLEENDRPPLSEGDHIVLLAAGICMTDIADSMSAGYAHMKWAPVAAPVALHESHAVLPQA